MHNKVLVIGSRDLTVGFSLAGAETRVAESSAAASEALSQARENGQYGVVILDEQLVAGFDDRTRQSLSGSDVPMVITVPGQLRWQDVEALGRDEYIAGLIRHAIGYQLDIKF